MVESYNIYGNTGCITTKWGCIPFYRLSENRWILMDSGWKIMRDELLQFFEENEIIIEAIITSHVHFDHVGNHMALREKYGSRIVMTAFDAGMTSEAAALKSCFYFDSYFELLKYYNELVIKADQIILPGQTEVDVCGARFEILWFYGHAASQIAVVTPDHVIYLADVLVSKEKAEKEKFLFMQEWNMAIYSINKLKRLKPYKAYILAHDGIFLEIDELIDWNLEHINKIMDWIYGLMPVKGNMDEALKSIIEGSGLQVKTTARAKFVERLLRSFIEYLVDCGKIQMEVENGIIEYIK